MAKNRPGWICQSQLDTSVLELPYVERYLALPLSVGDSMSGRASLPEQDSPSPRSLSPLGDRHRPREIQTPAPHATACCSRNEFFSKTCYESRTERKTRLAATSRQAGVKNRAHEESLDRRLVGFLLGTRRLRRKEAGHTINAATNSQSNAAFLGRDN